MTSWRDRLRPLVAAALAVAKAAGMTPAQTRKLLRERRPCGGGTLPFWFDEEGISEEMFLGYLPGDQ